VIEETSRMTAEQTMNELVNQRFLDLPSAHITTSPYPKPVQYRAQQ
jgi:hypothetical protein